MNYLRKHWRGELSLAVSFWINIFLINIAIKFFDTWLTQNSPIEHPVISARVTVIFTFIALSIIYPWQIVGMWRTCNRHVKENGKVIWARTAQVLVVLGFLVTLGNVNRCWPIYKELYQIGFVKDKFANYTLTLEKNNTLIHLKGGLGFGVSQDVDKILKNNPNVKGIILDSIGGRIYEGRELSKLILIYGLDTYSLEGCYSASTTAFIAGKNRFLGIGANLAFHQYNMGYKNLNPFVDLKKEQEKDLRIFERQGIKQEFLTRLFDTAHNDLWYPTIDEMISAGVIHGIVKPSDLSPLRYEASAKLSTKDFDEVLLNFPMFRTIKQYDPETYKRTREEFEEQIKKGASQLELQDLGGSWLAASTLPRTSNEAILRYVHVYIDIVKKLKAQDPILALKIIYPHKFGAIIISRFLSDDDMAPMMDAMNAVIIDAYQKENPPLDKEAAELLMQKLVVQLGSDAEYLEPQGLQNKEDYKKPCDALVKLFELILEQDKNTAGNALRYFFAQE